MTSPAMRQQSCRCIRCLKMLNSHTPLPACEISQRPVESAHHLKASAYKSTTTSCHHYALLTCSVRRESSKRSNLFSRFHKNWAGSHEIRYRTALTPKSCESGTISFSMMCLPICGSYTAPEKPSKGAAVFEWPLGPAAQS